MATDESELNQIFTVFAKDIQGGIRQRLKPDDGRSEIDAGYSGEESGSDEEEQTVKNARLFSEVMDDYQKLLKQETGMEDRVLGQVNVCVCAAKSCLHDLINVRTRRM